MFLQLNHQKLDVFIASRSFTLECYKFTKSLPADEKFNMTQQVRRAALSVYLNIAEGCSRKSNEERKRFFEISRGSLIEIDAVLDLCIELHYSQKENLQPLGEYMQRTFSMLTKMISVDIHV